MIPRFEAREGAQQHVHGGLGGEGAHEDHAGHGGLGVGVRQPGVQRDHRRVDAEAQHDQGVVEPRRGRVGGLEGEGAGGLVTQEQAGQKQQAAQDMKKKVADPARVEASRRRSQTRKVEATLISSQKMKSVT